jgi:hypothetical protein
MFGLFKTDQRKDDLILRQEERSQTPLFPIVSGNISNAHPRNFATLGVFSAGVFH